MAETKKLQGGVIVADGHHTHGLIEMLAFHVRDRVEIAYYPHPYQIDLDHPHDFIVVLSLDDLRNVVKFYDAKRQDLPLIAHIDDPATLRRIRHDALFPGVKVVPIPQANLNAEPGVTLEVSMFANILNLLTKAPDS
jgi:hypothetical protein